MSTAKAPAAPSDRICEKQKQIDIIQLHILEKLQRDIIVKHNYKR